MINDKLPSYYKKSFFIRYLSNALENEKILFLEYVERIKKEYFIKTTQNYIYDWEREFRVPSYLSQDLQTRRGNVLARFRGNGTTTKDYLKNIIEGFYEGESINITEDFEDSIIVLDFETMKELPENYSELQRSINELLPSHFGYGYKFSFALDKYTYEQLEAYEHKLLEGAVHSREKDI